MQTFRPLHPGIGEAVARRTIYRPGENWRAVAERVAFGNVSLLVPTSENGAALATELQELTEHIAHGRVLLSGRHLQHGDETQYTREGTVYTNCSTAASSALLFYLLLNGSGVGRAYHDALMLVDWTQQPRFVPLLEAEHPDYDGSVMTPEAAYATFEGQPNLIHMVVPDSREGWAKVVERLEALAFAGVYRDHTFLVDFSRVRPKGAPIGGMQNRPASGPLPLIEALVAINAVRERHDWPRWRQAIEIDHYLADCVVVGGARRSARMAIKDYRDPGVFDFINLKQHGALWTANNSVGVDQAFWAAARVPGTREYQIFEAVMHAQWEHGSGEPGFINLDALHTVREGLEAYADGKLAESRYYKLDEKSSSLYQALGQVLPQLDYPMIVNPCAEIPLLVSGGVCVIGDVVPFHCDSLEQALDAFAATTRALIRVNRMPQPYAREIARTNRIGVGITGVHEFAWKFFGLTFRDLVQDYDLLMHPEQEVRASSPAYPFWEFLEQARLHCEHEADRYSQYLVMTPPHTVTTAKPSGSVSKTYSLTEGVHLPAMKRYLRWVQFQQDDPLVDQYEQDGYPVLREAPAGEIGQLYSGVSLVGFPTETTIATLGIPDDRFVTAPEATPEEQFKWVRLLEHYWLGPRGNQISYTLKFDKARMTLEEWKAITLAWMPQVRCVSVMPASDWRDSKRKYGYVPEEPISDAEYARIEAALRVHDEETVNLDDLQCDKGGCPL